MNNIFCLVSRQTMANLLPVLMFKPKKIVLFETPEETSSAENLYQLFLSKNISVERVKNLNAYDFEGIKKIISDKAKNENDACLNITGGTKLMALAAYEAFISQKKEIIYCDTEHKNIIFLSPTIKKINLDANLTIEDYLNSYGYTIVARKNDSDAEKFFSLFEFINQTNSLKSFIKFFIDVRTKLHNQLPKFSVNSSDKLFRFIKEIDKYIIEFNSNRIIIQNPDFKSGDWLEYYVYYQLFMKYNIKPYLGVKIKNKFGVENEIDLLFLKDYILYLISCKSGKKDNQFDLYQLETLRTITGGTFGRGIFVTANQVSKLFINRAKELNIRFLNIKDNQFNIL